MRFPAQLPFRVGGFGRTVAVSGTAAALAVLLAACGSSGSGSHSSAPASGLPSGATPDAGSSATPAAAVPGMPGMDMGSTGLSDVSNGYRFAPAALSATVPAGRPVHYRFSVVAPGGGAPATDFAVEMTKRLHFYAVRSDLTGFQHVHPAMAPDGTWTADLAALRPGAWRVFATFTPGSGPGKGQGFVLSRTFTVPGDATATALPAAAPTTRVDGYTVAVRGELTAGSAHPLTVRITRAGQPVTDLQPYLGAYAHLTAFHAGDSAFAHLHPATPATAGRGGGPELVFHAEPASAGDWRLFLQFQAGGSLHTAALTLRVT